MDQHQRKKIIADNEAHIAELRSDIAERETRFDPPEWEVPEYAKQTIKSGAVICKDFITPPLEHAVAPPKPQVMMTPEVQALWDQWADGRIEKKLELYADDVGSVIGQVTRQQVGLERERQVAVADDLKARLTALHDWVTKFGEWLAAFEQQPSGYER